MHQQNTVNRHVRPPPTSPSPHSARAVPRRSFVLKGGMAVATPYTQFRFTRDVNLDFPPARLRTGESLHNQIRGVLQQALQGSRIVEVPSSVSDASPRSDADGVAVPH